MKTNELICDEMYMNMMIFLNLVFSFSSRIVAITPWFFFMFHHFLFHFPSKERSCICNRRRRRGNKRFDVHLRRIRSVHSPSKDGKHASYEKINGWEGVYFPPESAFEPLMLYFVKVLFPICALTWIANNDVFDKRIDTIRRH